MTRNNETAESRRNWTAIMWWVGTGVVLGLILLGSSAYFLFGKWESRGQFGDMFGFANAFFSALAFAGVIIAILLQRDELGLQRKELIQTRVEIRGQKEQLKAQAETLKKQNLENTFFQLLRFHQEILQSIEYNGKGRAAMRKIIQILRQRLAATKVGSAEARIKATYMDFHQIFQDQTGHYFRNLYHILKFVNESQAEPEDKKLYSRLVRAQLSSQELVLLFYNCLSELGSEKFKPLVEKYAMLKHVPRHQLADPAHVELYDPRAFGEGE